MSFRAPAAFLAAALAAWPIAPASAQEMALPAVDDSPSAQLLVEQAGGAATNGRTRILDLQPTSLHERVAVFMGSRTEVERVTGYHQP